MNYTSILTPALSSRRGRIIHRLLVKRTCNIVERSLEEMSTMRRLLHQHPDYSQRSRLSLSPGERAGVRASVSTIFFKSRVTCHLSLIPLPSPTKPHLFSTG